MEQYYQDIILLTIVPKENGASWMAHLKHVQTCKGPNNSICQTHNLVSTTKTENQVKGRLLLDVVVREGTAILKLLTSKDQTLLIRGDSLLVLDLRLNIVNGVRRLNIQGDGLASEGLNKNLKEESDVR